MGKKIWGAISALMGAFGLFRSYQLFHQGASEGKPWLLLLAGLVLIAMGVLQIRRKPTDPAAEL
jgi:hypothetical protein